MCEYMEAPVVNKTLQQKQIVGVRGYKAPKPNTRDRGKTKKPSRVKNFGPPRYEAGF